MNLSSIYLNYPSPTQIFLSSLYPHIYIYHLSMHLPINSIISKSIYHLSRSFWILRRMLTNTKSVSLGSTHPHWNRAAVPLERNNGRTNVDKAGSRVYSLNPFVPFLDIERRGNTCGNHHSLNDGLTPSLPLCLKNIVSGNAL